MRSCKDELWYDSLSAEGKGVANLIYKYHNYFSKKDSKYRRVVKLFKIIILILAMAGTIVFGLNGIIQGETQRIIGLCVSSSITFFTALSSYFNYEEYWTRNIRIHIQFNILRDEFCLDAEAGKLDNNRINYYKKELKKIQQNNIAYWERTIKK